MARIIWTCWPPKNDRRTELEKRLLADTCEYCGSAENVQVHHIRALKDLQRYTGREKPEWVKMMAARRRKTLILSGKLGALDQLAHVFLPLVQQYVTLFCTDEIPDAGSGEAPQEGQATGLPEERLPSTSSAIGRRLMRHVKQSINRAVNLCFEEHEGCQFAYE